MARKTKAQKAAAEREAQGASRAEAMVATVKAWEADPNSLWNNDPVWNPKHPDHRAVNTLITEGYSWPDAILKAEGIEPLQPEGFMPRVQAWFADIVW